VCVCAGLKIGEPSICSKNGWEICMHTMIWDDALSLETSWKMYIRVHGPEDL
jgi:hypothetical protein